MVKAVPFTFTLSILLTCAPVATPFNFVLSAALIKPCVDVVASAYVVFSGTTHEPSPLKNDACFPAAGAGTKPALPAALAVAAAMLE